MFNPLDSGRDIILEAFELCVVPGEALADLYPERGYADGGTNDGEGIRHDANDGG
jgi:hypothetical protein